MYFSLFIKEKALKKASQNYNRKLNKFLKTLTVYNIFKYLFQAANSRQVRLKLQCSEIKTIFLTILSLIPKTFNY